jgi:hypothetical protein
MNNLDTLEEAAKRYYKKEYSHSESSDSYTLATIFNIAKCLPLIGVFANIYELLHILIAPKLYLIEHFIK